MMKKITLKCRIITPLFMGGANQEAELRTQSFNGLFRYWFRLLGGSFEDEKRLFGWGGEGARKGLVQVFIEIDKIIVNKQKSQDFIINGQEWLKQEKEQQEEEIKSLEYSLKNQSKSQNKKEFDKINKKIQRLRENVEELDNNINELKRFENFIKDNDLAYTKLKEWHKAISILFKALTLKYKGLDYLGFSLKLLEKDFCPLDISFDLTIRFHPTATDEDIKKFLCALWCAFYLGNFGSRSRRGFGSVVIKEINRDIPNDFDLEFKSSDDICKWLMEQLNKIKNLNCWQSREDIPWIFENMEIYKVNKDNVNQLNRWIEEVQKDRGNPRFLINSWGLTSINTINDLHDFIGFLMAAYRSYYKPDYDLAKSIIQNPRNAQQNQIIERVIFGLPLNFYFSSMRRGAMVEASSDNEKLRRASPLIFKIISNGENFEGFIIVFKPNTRHQFKFLPDRARINLSGVNLQKPDWGTINDFIGSLTNHNLITKCYP